MERCIWEEELENYSRMKSTLVIEGNILDRYPFQDKGNVSLTAYLHYFFAKQNYKSIICYDRIQGFHNTFDQDCLETFLETVDSSLEIDALPHISFDECKEDSVSDFVYRAMVQVNTPSVIIMQYASRYITNPSQMEQGEIDTFTRLLQASTVASSVGGKKNLLILLCNKVNDLPLWFYLENPNVKTIRISLPSKEERAYFMNEEKFPNFFHRDIYEAEMPYFLQFPDELNKIKEKFIALTDGLSFREINDLRLWTVGKKMGICDLCDVIGLYKFGNQSSPWTTLDWNMISKKKFSERVKGQDIAIEKAMDVIKRAMVGLSGLQGSSLTRPKGVLFFAGPTGTGKTETAKTMAELLFGDENACIRFDMSEFSQSQSEQKLFGAPPGYVGYEAGGQLTNKIAKKPFSILLFDEIEKASPSIFDKFLQILEDGRMTDGQGNTVYFSESILIFTSNLGMYTLDGNGNRVENVTLDMTYEEMSQKIQTAIENFFKLQLGRPELLNRIGENIITFDFVRENVSRNILDAQCDRISGNLLLEKKIVLDISDPAKDHLYEQARKQLANGGRGIGNMVERDLINPLSRFLFDFKIAEGQKIVLLLDSGGTLQFRTL